MNAATLATHAAWTLLLAQSGSLAYEVWRTMARSDVSRFDSRRAFVQLLPAYVVAAGVVGALFADLPWAVPIALGFSLVVLGVSTFYYNPVVMPVRDPALIDWVEDIAYTAAHAVAATQLAYATIWLG